MKGDASAFMKGAISKNELWDLVILDPPKLAPRKKVLVHINTSSEPGGFTCECKMLKHVTYATVHYLSVYYSEATCPL